MRPACLYLRVSSDEQTEGVSLDVQESRCRAAAEGLGYTVADVFRDEGFSAFSRKPRPAYLEMLRRLPEYQCVFVYDLSRFGRRAREIHRAIDEVLQSKVGFYSVTEQFDLSQPMGWAMFSVSATFAELASRITQAKVRDAMERVASSGRKLSFAPYGYAQPAPKAPIVPDPATAPTVQRVFAAYADGATILGLARQLNAEGITTGRGRPWDHSRIAYMLSCRTYIGEIEHTRTGTVYPGTHDPLIARDLWERVQARRRRDRGIQPSSRGRSLSPLLRCGVCGGSVTKRGSAYHCRTNTNQAREARHERVFISAATLERTCWALVEWLIADEAEAAYSSLRRRTQPTRQSRNLTQRRDDLLAQMAYNLQAAREGAVDMRVLAEQNRPLQEALSAVETSLAQLESGVGLVFPARTLRRDVAEVRDSGDYARQLLLLQGVFSSVVVYPDRIAFQFADLPPLQVRRRRGQAMRDDALEFVTD